MSNAPSSPDTVVETYVAAWNETDAGRRGAAVAQAFAEKSTYRDPVMTSDGPAGIDAMLAGVQAKFPGFVLKRTSKVDTITAPCASPGRSGRRRDRRSSRVSISAPWRPMGGWRR